jgi:hypothetical protein
MIRIEGGGDGVCDVKGKVFGVSRNGKGCFSILQFSVGSFIVPLHRELGDVPPIPE